MEGMEGLNRLTADDWAEFSAEHPSAAAFLMHKTLKREAAALRVERAQGTPAAPGVHPEYAVRKAWVTQRIRELTSVGL